MATPRPVRGPARSRALPLPPGGLPVLLHGAFLLLLLALVEWAARFGRTDVEDAFAVMALWLVASLVKHRHRRDPLPWVLALGRIRAGLLAGARRRMLLMGVDLRREPPVPVAFPPALASALAAVAAGAVLLAAVPGFDALALRGALRSVSAALAATVLGAGWLLFTGGSLAFLFATFALTHDALVRAHHGPGPRRRGREALAFCGWTSALLLGWSLLPAWAPVALLAGTLLAALLVLGLPGGPDAPLLCMARADGSPLHSVSWRRHTLAGTACIGLLAAEAVIFARGGTLRGTEGAAQLAVLPLTTGAASLFAWTAAAALLAWCGTILPPPLRARMSDPARPLPARVRLEGSRGAAELAAAGLRVRTGGGAPLPCEVPVVVVDGPRDPFAAQPPGGPLVAPPGEIASGEALRRILRRRDVLARRRLLHGLEFLFRRAASRRFARGTGFWVAPWLWFCVGLSRDEDERSMDWREGTFFLETVGPSYRRVFPREAIRHVLGVMADLRVDLLFVEDGVGFRRLRRVLGRAFELHDRLGARGRAEDHHFTGIPGVRVMIHDFELEEPWKAKRKGWPEPDYESIGRARILHVFRDRGASEETADAPRDRRGAPVGA